MIDRTWYHALCPKFMTSIPKSGTFLLRHILRMEWPYNEGPRQSLETKHGDTWFQSGAHISPGEFHCRGHIACAPETIELTKDRVSFFLYRDPRDLIVSWAYFLDKLSEKHPFATPFPEINFTKCEDRILALIEHLPFLFSVFIGWLEYAIPVRYEGLINSPEKELAPVAAAIPEPLDYLVARSKMRASPTFRKAQPGNWKEEFKSHHMKEFNLRWGDIMWKLGYE